MAVYGQPLAILNIVNSWWAHTAFIAECCARPVYVLETRVTSLIWLKERVERPFILPALTSCSQKSHLAPLMGSEPFTAPCSSQTAERSFASKETLRKPVNLEQSVYVCSGNRASSLVPFREASLHCNYRSVRSALCSVVWQGHSG